VLLLHGSLSSRRAWRPVLADVAARRTVITPDFPGFGETPPQPGAATAATWAPLVASLLDSLGIERVAVAGHSMGGWTALELAKLGRARDVLALAPAGLWARRSPPLTDMRLRFGRTLARMSGPVGPLVLRSRVGRIMALRDHSGAPQAVPVEWALETSDDATRATGWPEHYHAARAIRFLGGQEISVPVRVVWGGRDRIARLRTSQHLDQLPSQTIAETWPGCGHMLTWDAPSCVATAILDLDAGADADVASAAARTSVG
jgi:pimeloyl-ACP methyl ester carboxylesterase